MSHPGKFKPACGWSWPREVAWEGVSARVQKNLLLADKTFFLEYANVYFTFIEG
jgi:hypothetical protein